MDLHRKGRLAEAEALYREIEARAPDNLDLQRGLGCLYAQRGDRERAEPILRRLIRDVPFHPDSYINLGAMLVRCEEYEAARRIYEKWFALENSSANVLGVKAPAVYYNYGLLLILLGEYRLGWTAYEFGRAIRKRSVRGYKALRWRGEAMDGKPFLIFMEQGMGDGILMARFLPRLKERTGAKIVLECPPALEHLMRESGLADEVIVFPQGDERMPCVTDNQMALPYLLGIETPEDVRCRPYLRPAGRRRTAPGAPLTAGICWRGNPAQDEDADRSIYDVSMLEILRPYANRWVSLQRDNDDGKPDWIEPGVKKEWNYLDTAKYIRENVDVVVTVCTSVLHLAGAMGVPTVGLLWKYHYCIWGLEGEKTPWYDSVRLVRQKTRGDWANVLLGAGEILKRGLKEWS